MRQYYTFTSNAPFDVTNILQLEVKEAIEINPAYFVIPNEGVIADSPLPGIKEGEVYIVVFEGGPKDLTVSKNVQVVKDYRGVRVWHKETAEETEWNKVFLDDVHTTLEPQFEFSKWGNDGWVEDIEQKDVVQEALVNQEFNAQLAETNNTINPLQDTVDLDMATEEEKAQLTAWKKYRVLLNRVKNQEGWPLNVIWPELPTP